MALRGLFRRSAASRSSRWKKPPAMQALLESTCSLVVSASSVVASYGKDKNPTVARLLGRILDEYNGGVDEKPPMFFSSAPAEPSGGRSPSPTAAAPMSPTLPVSAPVQRPVIPVGQPEKVCGPGLPLPLARRDAWCNALEIDKATVLERDDLRLNLSLAPELVKQVELDLPRTPLLTAHGLHGSRQARLIAQIGLSVLSERGLCYFQGFLDVVASVVLLLGPEHDEDERLCHAVVERVTLRLLRGQTSPRSAETKDVLLAAFARLVCCYNQSLGRLASDFPLEVAYSGLCALNTWLQRSTCRLESLGRLTDVLVRSPPLGPMYIFAAVLLTRMPQPFCELMGLEEEGSALEDAAELALAVKSFKDQGDVSEAELALALDMMTQVPPDVLLRSVLSEVVGEGEAVTSHIAYQLWVLGNDHEQGRAAGPAASLLNSKQHKGGRGEEEANGLVRVSGVGDEGLVAGTSKAETSEGRRMSSSPLIMPSSSMKEGGPAPQLAYTTTATATTTTTAKHAETAMRAAVMSSSSQHEGHSQGQAAAKVADAASHSKARSGDMWDNDDEQDGPDSDDGMVLLSEDDEVQATGCRGGWLGGWWGELAWLCDRVAGWLQCTAHALLGSWCGL